MADAVLERRNKFSYKALLLVVFAAFSVRLFWMVAQTANIEGEGAVYARLAENFLKGNGLVGISALGSTDWIFPPLYPILIAAFSLVVGEFELAGRLVSLVTGTCLVALIFFIASRMYGQGVAFIAASLVAFHPLLINLSASVYSEGTYITLLMGGVYWALRTLELGQSKKSVLSGICFGLAYLTRPEAIVYPFVTVTAIFVVAFITKQDFKNAATCSLRVLIPFVLIAAPYVAFLSLKTGQVRFEGKSANIYIIGQRMRSGMEYNEANHGIDENLNELGANMRDNLTSMQSVTPSLRDLASYVVTAAKSNIKTVSQIVFGSRSFGSPVLIVLVILGLFRTTWNHERLINESFLLLVASFIGLSLLSLQHFWERYAFPLLPFLILWASKGIQEFSEWIADTAASLKGTLLQNGKVIRMTAQWAMSAILVLFVAASYADEFKKMNSQKDPIKAAGLWLRDYVAHRHTKIMDASSVIPFYARGEWMPLPYAESSLALKYIRRKSPDFIVLTRGGSGIRPYLDEWIQNGIPDDNAELIYITGSTLEEKIVIYERTPKRTTDNGIDDQG